VKTGFIGKLYVAKATFGADNPPNALTVTIAEGKAEKEASA
jgi:hypothetical protein